MCHLGWNHVYNFQLVNNQTKRARAALTIAGSDCSGGAGLEADLKTFTAYGVYGMAVVTCVVAENPRKVVSIHPVPTRIVNEQIVCCLRGMSGVSVKTGMLYSRTIIRAVAKSILNSQSSILNLVVDPVMVATSGRRLLEKNAIRALEDLISEHADLVTPNLDEAEILAERKIRSESQMETAAHFISQRFSCPVLLKGGHLKDRRLASDFFWSGRQGLWLRSARVHGIRTHGTGCVYSAAITANLASGCSFTESVQHAKHFLTSAIRRAHKFGPWMALKVG